MTNFASDYNFVKEKRMIYIILNIFAITEVHPHSSDDENAPPSVLRCRVTFKSSRPVSFSQPVVFIDADGNMFSLMVTATADNCLLTCYPFLAQHRTDHQIVCEQVGWSFL